MPRYFTHNEAESLLPRVDKLLRDAVYLHAEHRSSTREFQQKLQQILVSGGMQVDQGAMAKLRESVEKSAKALESKIEEIQEIGCQIKDLEMGLVDFPTLYKGEEVLLCWRLGEDRIEFWHDLQEGFRGRKPIDAEFLANHTGGVD